MEIETERQNEMIDITSRISLLVRQSGIVSGTVTLFVPHTTAAVTINENHDSDVVRDLLLALDKNFPKHKEFRHTEGNSDAHLKSSVIGAQETVLIENGILILGTWQGIYFCEFDGPRHRKIYVRISGDYAGQF